MYVHTGSPLGYETWIRGLTAGKSFVTNGPLVSFKVDGHEPGDTLNLPVGRPTPVHVEADVRSMLPMNTLDIIQNGQVVFSTKAEDPYRVKLDTKIPVERSGWLAARVTGPEKQRRRGVPQRVRTHPLADLRALRRGLQDPPAEVVAVHPGALRRAEDEVARISEQYEEGLITDEERYRKAVDTWT